MNKFCNLGIFHWLALAAILLSPLSYAQDEGFGDFGEPEEEEVEWIVVEGEGVTQEGAVVSARRKALLKYLRGNMNTDDFETHRRDIEGYVTENWKRYCKSRNPIVQPYENQLLRVMVGIRSKSLLDDVQNKFLRAREKAAGFTVSLLLDPKKKTYQENATVMLSALSDELGKHFSIRDLSEAERSMRQENRAMETSAIDDPSSYAWEKFNLSHVIIYCAARAPRVYDRGYGRDAYQAEVHARGILKMNGQQIFNVRHRETGLSRSQSLEKASRVVADKIIKQVTHFNTVLPEQVYELKFIDFYEVRDRDNINKSLIDLTQKGYMKILPGGEAYGPRKFFQKVKWLRAHNQFLIRMIILEFCKMNQVDLRCDKTSPGLLIFVPGSSQGSDHGGSDRPLPPRDDRPAHDDRDRYEEEDLGDCYEVTGVGLREEYAIVDGWKKAMMEFLRDNMDYDDLQTHEQKIQKWLNDNWKDYTTGKWDRLSRREIIYAWDRDRQEITICVNLKEDRLLKDIRRLTEKVRDKLAGYKVAVLYEKDSTVAVGEEKLDQQTMFAGVSNILGAEMQLVDLPSKFQAMKFENLSHEVSAVDDPASYSMEVWNHANQVVLLSLSTWSKADPSIGGHRFWFAKISCRMIDRQTGDQPIRFQLESSAKIGAGPVSSHIRGERKARDEAIRALSQVVARKVIDQCRKRKTILEENIYTLKFTDFTRSEGEKIEQMVLRLSSGRAADMKVMPGTVMDGRKITYKVKWLRTKDDQVRIVNTLKKECEMLGLKIGSNKSRQGLIWFERIDYDPRGDE